MRLVKDILSSWSHVKLLCFKVQVNYDNEEHLRTLSKDFFGTQQDFIPAILPLEELHVSFEPLNNGLRLRSPYNLMPRTMIPSTSWVFPHCLPNLKDLTLDCYAGLDSSSFAALVHATPHLEHFRSFVGNDPQSGLHGLRPADLLAVSVWQRLRSCHLSLDVSEAELAAPPSRGKFVQLNDPYFMRRLVESWKEGLNELECVDISCRVVKDRTVSAPYPLAFASLCDCGKVHFHVDAEGPAAKRLGFL